MSELEPIWLEDIKKLVRNYINLKYFLTLIKILLGL